MDLSTLYPRERCACGSWLRRMAPFAGRADNMVKLRGVNVWPEAVGEIALVGSRRRARTASCAPSGRGDATTWSSTVTSDADPSTYDALAAAVEARLAERLGVKIRAEVVAPGALDAWTEVGTSPKLKRFRDDR